MIGPHPGREIGTFIYGTNIPAMVKELRSILPEEISPSHNSPL